MPFTLRNKKKVKKDHDSDSFIDNRSSVTIHSETDPDDSDWDDQAYKKEKKMEKIIGTVLKKQEINFDDIHQNSLLEEDKINLIEKYNIYMYMEDNTIEKLKLKKEIKHEIIIAKENYNRFQKLSKRQKNNFEKTLKELKSSSFKEDNILHRIFHLNTNMRNKKIIYKKYKKFENLISTDDEYPKLKSWLNCVIQLPFNTMFHFNKQDKKIEKIISEAYYVLNKNIYGMKKVKEKILMYTSIRMQNPKLQNASLGLVGPPGVGKTLMSRTLSDVLKFPFEQISFGGVTSPEFLKGHDYTYIGSHPGEISQCLTRMKCNNGIIFFDEFDKISKNKSICNALLHITDPIQNKEYKDNYLCGVDIDLSNIWFVYSMNEIPEDRALKDRIHMIELSGYTRSDKVNIILEHIVPKTLSLLTLDRKDMIFTKSIAEFIIDYTENESIPGIRELQHNVNELMYKIYFYHKHPKLDFCLPIKFPLTITKDLIKKII